MPTVYEREQHFNLSLSSEDNPDLVAGPEAQRDANLEGQQNQEEG